jgi:HEAT repeat protein
MSNNSLFTSRREVSVPSNRNIDFAARTVVSCVAMALAVFQLSANEAGAQEEMTRGPSDPRKVMAAGEDLSEEASVEVTTTARQQLESALDSDHEHVRWFALMAVRTLSETWIAKIVLPLCDSPDITERGLALEVVASSNPVVGRDAFLRALISVERSIRLRGVLGLAALGDDQTVANLVTIMTDDSDPDLRAAAARALGDIGDNEASDHLYEAMKSPFHPVRKNAVMSLLAIGDEDVVTYLVGELQEPGFPGELEILRLMALIPDPTLIDPISPYLEHSDAEVRTQAATAVFSILERSGNARP